MADVKGEEQEENFRYENEEDLDVFRDASKNSEHLIDDSELEALRMRMKEIEDEAEVLRRMQNEVEKQFGGGTDGNPPQSTIPSLEEQMEIDSRSIYIGNVDYSATAEDLEAHFHGCGSVNRVTILTDRYTGHPKGYAYMEFADKSCVQLAVQLSDTLFHGRQILVSPKRTNKPGMGTTNRSMRGRGRGSPRVIVKYVYGGPYRNNKA